MRVLEQASPGTTTARMEPAGAPLLSVANVRMSFGGIGIILVILAVAWFAGIDPTSLLGGGGGGLQFPSGAGSGSETGKAGVPSDQQGKFVASVLGDTEDAWTAIFKRVGKTYEPHIFEGAGHGFLRQQTGANGANMKATEAAWPLTVAFLTKYTK